MVREILSKIPTYPDELGLNLNKPEDRFKWFLASILFAKRISSAIAIKTFQKLVEESLTTPEELLNAGWDKLVEVLDSGGYVRYDFSTATNLIEAAKLLKQQYGGSLEELHQQARDSADLEKRLLEFKGVGEVAVNIFLRELRGIWSKANPKVSSRALDVAKKLGIDKKDLGTYESKLVRINLQYCRKHRCRECLVKDYCSA
jgi:endonuclease III